MSYTTDELPCPEALTHERTAYMTDENAPPDGDNPPPDEPTIKPPKLRRISMEAELSALSLCMRSVEILALQADTFALGEEEAERDALGCIAVLMSLVGSRMELLRSAVMGELNPALVWAPHNNLVAELPPGSDLILTEWGPEHRRTH